MTFTSHLQIDGAYRRSIERHFYLSCILFRFLVRKLERALRGQSLDNLMIISKTKTKARKELCQNLANYQVGRFQKNRIRAFIKSCNNILWLTSGGRINLRCQYLGSEANNWRSIRTITCILKLGLCRLPENEGSAPNL